MIDFKRIYGAMVPMKKAPKENLNPLEPQYSIVLENPSHKSSGTVRADMKGFFFYGEEKRRCQSIRIRNFGQQQNSTYRANACNPKINPILAEIEILSTLFKSLIYQVKIAENIPFSLMLKPQPTDSKTRKARVINPGFSDFFS